MKELVLNLSIKPQPTETTCGPTCLQSLYSYYGIETSLERLIEEIPAIEGGGTLGVHLAANALARKLNVTIFSYNLQVFDPTWFLLEKEEMEKRLMQQALSQKPPKTRYASLAYQDYLKKGGNIVYRELTPKFLHEILSCFGPIICGLSATYLYQVSRSTEVSGVPDDIYGNPEGHFVVLSGISSNRQKVRLLDPYGHKSVNRHLTYEADTMRFISSILLGVITYDANLIAMKW